MEQQAIRIETLGDLVAHGYGMNAMCEKCRHRADLDMAALIARFGEGFIYVGRTLDGRLVCSQCGAHDVHCQIHPLNSNRSRFADWAMDPVAPEAEGEGRHRSAVRRPLRQIRGCDELVRGQTQGRPWICPFATLLRCGFGVVRPLVDDQERVHTTIYVYSTPGYGGEKAAITYAALLPAVPAPPELVRKAWARLVHWN
jgi:hypothetical protein